MTRIGIQGSCVDGKHLWFSLEQANGLCRMDLETNDVEYIGMFVDEPSQQDYLFADIKKYNDFLILTPMNALGVAIYNITNRTFSRIPLSTETIRNQTGFEKWSAFYTSIILDEYIYMLPYRFPGIMRIDLITMDVEYDDAFMDDIVRDYDQGKIFFREDIAVNEDVNEAYAVSLHYGGIFRISETESSARFILKTKPDERAGFSCIQFIKDKFVLLQMRKKRILVFDKQWRLEHEFSYSVSLPEGRGRDFIGSIKHGNDIYFIPFQSLKMMRFNIETEEIDYPIQYDREPYYVRWWIYKNRLYCYGQYRIEVVCLDTMERNEIILTIEKNLLSPIVEASLEEDGAVYEKGEVDLPVFLDYLLTDME